MIVSVIASRPRTGSTVLAETLGQHPLIKSFGEVFHHEKETRKWFHTSGGGEGEPYSGKPDEYILRLAKQAEKEGKKALVFKLMDYQSEQAWDWLKTRGIKVLHLRRNPIDCVISNNIAEKTGVWHARNDEDQKKGRIEEQIELDWRILESYFFRDLALTYFLKAEFKTVRTVSYEDMLAPDVAGAANKIVQRYYGLPAHEFKASQAKIGNTARQQKVSNWDALKNRYAKTQFEKWFN